MDKIRKEMMRNIRQTFNTAKITIISKEAQLAYTIRRDDQRMTHTKTKTRTTGKNMEEK